VGAAAERCQTGASSPHRNSACTAPITRSSTSSASRVGNP
jgi:hypothetical protein